MGTRVEVVLVGPPGDLLAHAKARLADLEARWSRFRPESETSALNRAGGRPVAVSPETFTMIALALLGWLDSGGRFDPTVLDALELAGYDRSFDQVAVTTDAGGSGGEPAPARGLRGMVLDGEAGTVALPPGTRFDPGGIGKGYAADLLCAELRAGGAEGACVNVGGDLRVSGRSPHGARWAVAVPHPRGGTAAVLEVADGAVATSSPARRSWRVGGRRLHHLIDPRTGLPGDSGLLQVTVVTAEGWRAEVAAKAAFLAGLPEALDLAAALGAEALVIDHAGQVHATAGLRPHQDAS
jgi:thiamine biosynthesis lipoprotein